MEQVRIALIGAGSMGRKYAEMIDKNREGLLVLTAVCCRNQKARQWARETLSGDTAVCDSVEAMYEEGERFDAVLIVTPHKTHPQLVVQAFEHGKHVFCDKPSGISLLQCARMNEAAETFRKKFAMMFHQRLYPKYNRIKEIMESGELGTVKRVLLENSRYFRTWRYHRSADWRSSWNGEGGGALINQGQHILDIWQWLFGMPKSLYAMIPFGKYNDFSVDDEATILMEYPSAMTAAFILTTGEGTRTEKLEIVGTKGTLLLDNDTLHIWKYSEDTGVYARTASCSAREELCEEHRTEEFELKNEPYPEMFLNFAEAVLENRPLIAPGAEGMRALELTNAAYLSAWLGKKIELPMDAALYERELEKRMEDERNTAAQQGGNGGIHE